MAENGSYTNCDYDLRFSHFHRKASPLETVGPQSGPKWSASSSLGMKALFTLSGAEGIDSAPLRSTLGVP